MKKCILGMAKSNLDLRGGKSRNLELDYLRLIYTISWLQDNGWDAKGYLFVATDIAKKRIEQWVIKYQPKYQIEVIYEELSKKDIDKLKKEKKENAMGNIPGLKSKYDKKLSIAKEGEAIGRIKLKEAIERDNPNIVDMTTQEELFPLRIRWDYYGKTKTTNS